MPAFQLADKFKWAKGTGFSPYIDSTKPTRALAPEGILSAGCPALAASLFLRLQQNQSGCTHEAPRQVAFSSRKSHLAHFLLGHVHSGFALGWVFATAAFLTGCKPVGPNYNRPGYEAPPAYKEAGASAVLVPPPNPANGGGWQSASPSDGMLRGKWWEIYQDPQLNQLEERIATNNQSLRQALETYLAARDQVTAARSALFPTLSAGSSVSRQRISANGPDYTSTKPSTYNDLVVDAQASWEPDFWGRIRRTVEAAHENAQASAADQANIDLSLRAEMAADYFQLRGLDSETKLLNATVADLEHQLDLAQRRLDGGVATGVDVAQAKTQLETVRAQLIDVGVARAQYEHAIGTIANLKLS